MAASTYLRRRFRSDLGAGRRHLAAVFALCVVLSACGSSRSNDRTSDPDGEELIEEGATSSPIEDSNDDNDDDDHDGENSGNGPEPDGEDDATATPIPEDEVAGVSQLQDLLDITNVVNTNGPGDVQDYVPLAFGPVGCGQTVRALVQPELLLDLSRPVQFCLRDGATGVNVLDPDGAVIHTAVRDPDFPVVSDWTVGLTAPTGTYSFEVLRDGAVDDVIDFEVQPVSPQLRSGIRGGMPQLIIAGFEPGDLDLAIFHQRDSGVEIVGYTAISIDESPATMVPIATRSSDDRPLCVGHASWVDDPETLSRNGVCYPASGEPIEFTCFVTARNGFTQINEATVGDQVTVLTRVEPSDMNRYVSGEPDLDDLVEPAPFERLLLIAEGTFAPTITWSGPGGTGDTAECAPIEVKPIAASSLEELLESTSSPSDSPIETQQVVTLSFNFPTCAVGDGGLIDLPLISPSDERHLVVCLPSGTAWRQVTVTDPSGAVIADRQVALPANPAIPMAFFTVPLPVGSTGPYRLSAAGFDGRQVSDERLLSPIQEPQVRLVERGGEPSFAAVNPEPASVVFYRVVSSNGQTNQIQRIGEWSAPRSSNYFPIGSIDEPVCAAFEDVVLRFEDGIPGDHSCYDPATGVPACDPEVTAPRCNRSVDVDCQVGSPSVGVGEAVRVDMLIDPPGVELRFAVDFGDGGPRSLSVSTPKIFTQRGTYLVTATTDVGQIECGAIRVS